jgi:hypothetical protein
VDPTMRERYAFRARTPLAEGLKRLEAHLVAATSSGPAARP